MIKAVHPRFEAIAKQFADKVAVCENQTLRISYRELNERSNILAHVLRMLGVGSDNVVGVIANPNIKLVISLLSVFKSGGIYLPVDIASSRKRLTNIFDQCAPLIVITELKLFEDSKALLTELNPSVKYVVSVDESFQYSIYSVDTEEMVTVELPDSYKNDPVIINESTDGNYIYYTSGSTGEAKGILGSHMALDHFISWEIKEFNITADFNVSQLTQFTFDASLRDIFVPLCVGGTLHIPSEETKRVIGKLISWIKSSEINLIHTVPTFFRLLTKELKAEGKTSFPSLKYILLSGELMYGKDVKSWQETVENNIELVNLYGATETTLIKTFHRIGEVSSDLSEIIPAGKPIDSSIVAIINNGSICGKGEIGEIYIKTPFSSKGYYKNEALTRSVFVQNPLVKDKEDLVYKTGDLGRYVENWNIQVLGRIDQQVKINGVRVELEEIERALYLIPQVTQVIVTTFKNGEEQLELVCYYTGEQLSEEAIRGLLKKEINETSIPAYFIFLEQFPLNINGKVDRKALPLPTEYLTESNEFEAPHGVVEEKLVEIWKSILGLQKISRQASFFKLGGSSLKAIQVISKIYKTFNVLIKVSDIFSNPSIKELSIVVGKGLKGKYEEIKPLENKPYYTVSNAQRIVWLTSQQPLGNIAYNMPISLVLRGELIKEYLEKALLALVERHEVLRTTFFQHEGEVVQQISPLDKIESYLDYKDFRGIENAQERVKQLIEEEQLVGFDLEKGPLLRAMLFQLEEENFIFFFSIHHIICDRKSLEVIKKEIFLFYNSLSQGTPVILQPLSIHYKDFAAWQNDLLISDLNAHYIFWQNKLKDNIPLLNIPTDYSRPLVKTYKGGTHNFTIATQLSEQIRQLCRNNTCTPFMFFLALVKILLFKYTGQKDIIVGSPISGRSHEDLENQIGLYLNNLILRNYLDKKESFAGFLNKIKETTVEAYQHQIYPFDKLVEEFWKDKPNNRNPFYDVLLVVNDANHLVESQNTEAKAFIIEEFEIANESSKFDLTFFILDYKEINITIEYNSELFKTGRVVRIGEDLKKIISTVLEDKDVRIDFLLRILLDDNTLNIQTDISTANIQMIEEDF